MDRPPGLGVALPLGWFERLVDWGVHTANAGVFHVRETLIPVNGSGDTSYAWAQLWLFLSVVAIACVVWTILDRRRTNHDRLAYWLRLVVRYYIATAALSYGIIKLFVLQMPFPALSQLATPLGDLLPMGCSSATRCRTRCSPRPWKRWQGCCYCIAER